jgi:periplasmic divalent cation tolerance protein
VHCTAPTAAVAASLASALVDARLAACVTTVPGASSTYRWKGAVTTDTELLLLIKTRRTLLPELTALVVEKHPYDVPEIVATPLVGGLADYLQWIGDSTRDPRPTA